jgi:hypothetical protein
MTTETKIVVALLLVYLWFHWQTVTGALASGASGSAGNVTPGLPSTGLPYNVSGPGNVGFRETWGTSQ